MEITSKSYLSLSYANMMDKRYEDVTSEERSTGKTLNFGTTYGLEDENLALNLYGDTTEFHQAMARQARDQYFAGIPTLRDYFEAVRDEAQDKGYAETLFGRRRDIDEFKGNTTSEYKIGSGRRKAGNLPVQGTAADIMKKAMIRLRNMFRNAGYMEDMVRLTLNVHDEVAIHIHRSIHPYTILKIVREAMEMDMSQYGFPPLYIGANVGYAWSDGGEDDLEAPVLLMDEMVEVARQAEERGEELTPQADPRTEWYTSIRDFALRQVDKEITDNGYTTEDECHANGRLVKYSRYYKNADKVIAEVLGKGYEKVKDIVEDIENADKYVWESSGELVVEEGKNVEEEVETVQDIVKRSAKYSKKRNTIRIILQEPDSGLLTALDKMLVSSDSMEYFNDDQKYFNIEIDIGESIIKVRQRGLLSGMRGLLREFLTTHVTGGSYDNYEFRIEEVGSELLK